MGEVIRLHGVGVDVGAPDRERSRICCVVDSFRSRADAERAADLIAGHLRFPGMVAIVMRPRRFLAGTQCELTVAETHVDRAAAVLSIAARSPSDASS